MRRQSVITGRLASLSPQSPRSSLWNLQLRLQLQFCVSMTWFDWIQNARTNHTDMIMIKNYRIIPAFATVSFLLAQEIVSLMMGTSFLILKSKNLHFSSFFKKKFCMLICFSFIKVLCHWCTCLYSKFHNKELPTYLHGIVVVYFILFIIMWKANL